MDQVSFKRLTKGAETYHNFLVKHSEMHIGTAFIVEFFTHRPVYYTKLTCCRFGVMKWCWQPRPNDRPTFVQIMEELYQMQQQYEID